jgi:hypothetical protein
VGKQLPREQQVKRLLDHLRHRKRAGPCIRINLLSDSFSQKVVRPQIPRFPRLQFVVDFWHWSAKWPWELLALGVGIGWYTVSEYAATIVFFSTAGWGATSKVIHEEPRIFTRILRCAGIVGICLLAIYAVNAERGNKPWSHLQHPVENFVTNMENYVANKWFPLSKDAINAPALPPRLLAPAAPTIEKVPIPKIVKSVAASRPAPPPEERSEMAEVKARFVNPELLSIMATNTSQFTVWDTKIEVEFWDLDEPRNLSPQTALGLPIFVSVSTGDFLKAGESYTPRTVLDLAKSSGRLKDGDRLAGYGAITCSNCKNTHWYWIYYIEGKGGWYSAIPLGQGPDELRFANAIPGMTKDPESWFGRIPLSERLQIE